VTRGLALAVVFGITQPLPSLAGAWPQPEGEGLAILQLTPYTAEVDRFGPGGERLAGGGSYRRIEFAPYVEYGLTRRLTVVVQPRMQTVWGDVGTATGLAQTNLALLYALHLGERDAFAIQAGIGTPGVGGDDPRVAEPNADYELRLLYGRSVAFGGVEAFGEIQAAFRRRSGAAADELRLDLTAGLMPAPGWMLLAQGFSTFGLRNADPGGADYDMHRVQLSVVRDLAPRVSVQLGAFHELDGRNTALGTALVAALWLRF
jgi:hypothetical protein